MNKTDSICKEEYLKFEIIKKIQQEFENGREYYALNGITIIVTKVEPPPVRRFSIRSLTSE